MRNILAEAVCFRLSQREARVQYQGVHVGFVVDSVLVGEVFLRELQFPMSVIFHQNPTLCILFISVN